MSAYLKWLAPQYDQVQADLETKVSDLREKFANAGHFRVAPMTARLAAGFQTFLQFATASSAVEKNVAEELNTRCIAALGEFAAAQARYHSNEDPVTRFIELLSAVVASGRAHFDFASGLLENPAAWGWRHRDDGWHPQGDLVGWIKDGSIYLEPDAAFKAAQNTAPTGDGIPIGVKTLARRLRDKGVLASTDEKRHTITVRKVIDGMRREVLHLRPDIPGLALVDPVFGADFE
jgi:hypothetical protein